MQRVQEIKILLVDDEPNILQFLEMGLSCDGFRVQTAQEGAAALQLAQQFQPHIVILDLMMPGLDGFEVCSRLHDICDPFIVMVTAQDEAKNLHEAKKRGVEAFLTKPFAYAELLELIYAETDEQFPGISSFQ